MIENKTLIWMLIAAVIVMIISFFMFLQVLSFL